jgi:hypothetical protein
VVAKIEWYPGKLFPRIGFIVTNMMMTGEAGRRVLQLACTAEQWIKDDRNPSKRTEFGCGN